MKKIFSITLAIYFLATSVGFGVNTHFCDGEAIKSAVQLTQEELGCGMKMEEAISCETAETSIKKKNCCENHFEVFQVEDDFQSTDFQKKLHPIFFTAFVSSFLAHNFSEVKQNSFLEYSPPLVNQDFIILFQNFRI